MRMIPLVAFAALSLTTLAVHAETHETTIVSNSGKTIGSAKFTAGPRTTVIRLTLGPGALSPGWHGIHLHAVGDCSDPEKFMASKGHVNHGSKKHGLLNPDGPDNGDLPNIFATADGAVSAEVSVDATLSGQNGLKAGDGSALVIHANADDHSSQPIGGAGARVACGVIK